MQHRQLGPGGRYTTRPLTPPDLPHLQRLFETASDYFEIATGTGPAPDEAPRAFVAGPPTKAVDDKRVIGVFAGSELIGVLDAITDWPAPGDWTMGMLLLAPAHRGGGLGSAVLAAYEAWARRAGAARFRTAIVSHHAPGIRFLERHGYRRTTADGPHRAAPGISFFVKPAV